MVAITNKGSVNCPQIKLSRLIRINEVNIEQNEGPDSTYRCSVELSDRISRKDYSANQQAEVEDIFCLGR